jgi:hypothetical protein
MAGFFMKDVIGNGVPLEPLKKSNEQKTQQYSADNSKNFSLHICNLELVIPVAPNARINAAGSIYELIQVVDEIQAISARVE